MAKRDSDRSGTIYCFLKQTDKQKQTEPDLL